jgi:hypothetical protein
MQVGRASQTLPVINRAVIRQRGIALWQAIVRLAIANRWMRAPLALAIGVRVAVFVAGNVGARALQHIPYVNPFETWRRMDAVWYVKIAEVGYHWSAAHPFGSLVDWFPLYPITIWLTQHLLGWLPVSYDMSMLLAGMLISWVTFGVACVLLYRLTWDRFGRRTAYYAVLLLAVFPFSFYFGAAFSESLYLTIALAAFIGIERHNWWLAGGAALLAGALRPPGLIIAGCVILAYALDWLRTRHPLRPDVLWLGLTPLGTFAYLAYCWIRFGDPLAYVKTSKAGWNGGHLQVAGIDDLLYLLRHTGDWLFGTAYSDQIPGFYALLIILSVLASIPIWRLLGPPYALYAFLSIVAPIATFPNISSTGRYVSVIFPIFMVVGYALRRRPLLREAVVLASAVFLALFAVLFVNGYGLA